jgi:ABC-type nitrate/sulfonate/bicarbonate transport system permease component
MVLKSDTKVAERRSAGRRSKGAMLMMHKSGRPPFRGILPLIVVLVLWQIFGADKSIYFPRPSTWFTSVWAYAADGSLLEAVVATVRSFVAGLAIAIVVGVAIGVIVGNSKRLDRMLGPTLEFLRATPSSAQVPVFVLLLGYGESMKLTVVVLTALFPILLSTRSGAREMPPILRDVAKTLHLSTFDRIRKVTIPALFAPIFTGIRIAVPVVLIVVLIVEILTQINGIGASLTFAQQYYKSSLAYGLIVITAAVAWLANYGIGALNERLFRNVR